MKPSTFKALADPNRFQIIELLREKPRSVGELAETLEILQPQTSKHLKILADAGIVVVRPKANLRIYELSPRRFLEIDQWLEDYRNLWEERFDQLEILLEEIQFEKDEK